MKPHIVIIALAIVSLLGLACNQVNMETVDIEKEKELLIQTDKEFSQASIEKGSAEAFRMYLAEDAVQLPTRAHPVIGREAIYQSMLPNSGTYALAWEPSAAEVAKAGDMAYTWGMFNFTYQDSTGTEKTSYGKYLNVWKKQEDGTWKVVVDMGN